MYFTILVRDFPGGTVGKNPAKEGHVGLTPGLE